MTYKEWAAQYYESAANVKSKIERLKAEKKEADPIRTSELEDEIRILYGMYIDCMHVGDTLVRRTGEC